MKKRRSKKRTGKPPSKASAKSRNTHSDYKPQPQPDPTLWPDVIGSPVDGYGRFGPELGKHRLRVHAAYRAVKATGATLDELPMLTGIVLQAACRPRLDLEQAGIIVWSGRKRRTRCKQMAKVWLLAEYAKAVNQ